MRPEERSQERQRPPARAMRAAGILSLLLLVSRPAVAQLADLRGEVPENVLQNAPLDNNATGATPSRPGDAGAADGRGIQAAPYQPSSAGAVPDAPNSAETGDSVKPDAAADPNQSLFDSDEPPDDLDPAAKPVTRQLSTAKIRAETQRASRTSQPETAAKPSDDAGNARAASRQGAASATGDPEDVDTTGTVRQGGLDASDNERNIRGKPASAAAAAIEGHAIKPEDEPFAPVGIRVGGFVLRSSLDEGATYTTNANSVPEGGKAVLSESTLRLNAVSDWSDSVASVNAYGSYRKTLSGTDVTDPEGGIDVRIEHDIGDDTKALATLTYVVKPEDASSPVEIVGTLSEPLSQVLDASVGFEKDEGKLRYGVTGKVERLVYGDADLSSGGTVSQEERNSTLGSIVLRGGYEISPALTPFVEGEVGRRLYDVRVDSDGGERSATRLAARVGLDIDLRDKLQGEIAAGWVQERLDGPDLPEISAPTVSANLTWSPERETKFNLNGTTTVEGSTTSGESGSVLYAGTATATRNLRANLTGSAALGLSWRDYVGSDGHDLTLAAEGSMTWWLNRYFGLTTRLRHENVESNLPGRTTQTDSAFLGVTLQR